MAEIKNIRELMHHCCEVNYNYMRLPAGQLDKYRNLTALYKRLAGQSLLCSDAWLHKRSCPDHEPAVDAFWWAVVAWAEAFGISVGMKPEEWSRVFIDPHRQFAIYLKDYDSMETIYPHAALPAEAIMELDVRWMKLVIKLTSRWGLFRYLNDMPALREAQTLERELREDGSKVRDSYLRSDLVFFDALFKPFPFLEQTKLLLNDWLAMANPDNKG